MDLQRKTASERSALLLFGSRARGEAAEHSDIDLLVISPPNGPRPTGDLNEVALLCGPSVSPIAPINILYRSESELQSLLDSRSLFALHLQLEGRVLRDEAGLLVRLLRRAPVKVDLRAAETTLRADTAVLFAEEIDPTCPAAYAVARHLARTATFLNCVRAGKPTFSATLAGEILGDRGIAALLEWQSRPTHSVFKALRDYVVEYVGSPQVVGASLTTLQTHSRFASQVIERRTVLRYDPPAEDLLRAGKLRRADAA